MTPFPVPKRPEHFREDFSNSYPSETTMYHYITNDLGTPASDSTQQVTVEIDGHSVTVPAGTSIMRAARASASRSQALRHDSLKAFGSCRLCLIEMRGARAIRSCTRRWPRE